MKKLECTTFLLFYLILQDLMFIDPDDNMPLAMVCEFYNNDVNFVYHDTPLNVMFNEFKSGEKGHMAFVQVLQWFSGMCLFLCQAVYLECTPSF